MYCICVSFDFRWIDFVSIYCQGALFKKIKSAELLWNLEDGGSLLNILLVKMNYKSSEEPWPSLMEDSRYKLEDSMYEKLKKNVEMEKLKQQVT